MQPEIQPDRLFSTLQALVEPEMGWYLAFPNHEDGGELEPFVWDASQQGEFTPLNLMQSEGWVTPVAADAVLESWQKPERVGSVNGEAWLVPEQDAAKILLDESTRTERVRQYQKLLAWLQSELQNLQAFQLSCDSEYSLAVLAGELAGETRDEWLALAPLVPVATQITTDSPIQMASVASSPESNQSVSIEAVQDLLTQLGTIQLYGYYGGGYEQIHDYRLVDAVADGLDPAIEQTIQQAGLFSISEFEALLPNLANAEAGIEAKFNRLEQFLNQTFPRLLVYRFSFWNREHFYILGQLDQNGSNIWGGVVLRSQFTYNP